MSKKIYVGGLSQATTDQELQTIFAEQGTVISAVIITNRDSGRSRGFGFVEMSSDQEANHAIDNLDGKSVDGRNIMVNEAREREPRQAAYSRS